MTPIVVHVHGLPRAQPRARHVKAGKGKFRVAGVIDPGIEKYRGAVKRACQAALGDQTPEAGAVALRLEFWFATARRERHGLPHTAKPDADNLAKLWMDCAQDAGLLPKGDERVAELHITKSWAPVAGALMTLRVSEALPLDDDDDLGATEGADSDA